MTALVSNEIADARQARLVHEARLQRGFALQRLLEDRGVITERVPTEAILVRIELDAAEPA